MARYTTLTPTDEQRIKSVIARLELDGYHSNKLWKETDSVKAEWPHAAVNALVNLFTGQNPLEDTECKGVEIPEALGWHIAVLMEAWCDLGTGLDQYKPIALNNEDSLREYMISRHPKSHRPSPQAVEHRKDILTTEHARYRQKLVQRWYSDGIRLYHATQG